MHASKAIDQMIAGAKLCSNVGSGAKPKGIIKAINKKKSKGSSSFVGERNSDINSYLIKIIIYKTTSLRGTESLGIFP